MNKKRKRFITIIVIIIIVALLLILKPDVSPHEVTQRKTITLYQTKINADKPFLVELALIEDIANGLEKINMTYAKNGEDIYTRVDGLLSVGTLKKDGKFYTIYHDNKTYKLNEDMDYSNDFILFDKSIADMNYSDFESGLAEIMGAQYSYEEIKKDDDIIRFYYNIYDGAFEYLEIKENIFEVVKCTNEVDEKLFEIPDNYAKEE
ncbi:MAG: hypothetical protein IJS47_04680 [Clostridia bacterium]|nr:hypothetical protein [Clostridia bacterium]